MGHAKKERVLLFGTDQRITSGPAAKRPHSKAGYMTAPEHFADSQIPLAPRAPSIHGLGAVGPWGHISGACACGSGVGVWRWEDVGKYVRSRTAGVMKTLMRTVETVDRKTRFWVMRRKSA